MSGHGAVAETAAAKLNLTLHVVGRRDDGYHLLDSLVVFLTLADSLRFMPADTLSLTLSGRFAGVVPDSDDNLVLRAARALARAMGVDAGARILLHKDLPAAAGLGGGSADAAATLRGLARLWGIAPARDMLLDLALGLGADVPACLDSRPVQLAGIGEVLDPAPPLPPCWLVLVNPGVPLETKAVFGRWREAGGMFSPPMKLVHAPATPRELADAIRVRANDLTPPAVQLLPVIEQVLLALAQRPGCLIARMSGSGPTCFGIFDGPGEAHEAAKVIARERPSWWVAPTRMAG